MHAIYAAILRSEFGPVFLAEVGDASHLKAELRSVLARVDTQHTQLLKEKVLRYECYIKVHVAAPASLLFVVLCDGGRVTRNVAADALERLQMETRARDDLNLMDADGERPLQTQLQPMITQMMEAETVLKSLTNGITNSNIQSSMFQTNLNESIDATGDAMAGGSSSGEHSASRLDKLRSEVANVKEVMASNVERVLARGDRLDDLVDRSNDLEASSAEFRTSAYRVRRVTCWRSAKWSIILTTVGITLLLGFVVFILYELNVFK